MKAVLPTGVPDLITRLTGRQLALLACAAMLGLSLLTGTAVGAGMAGLSVGRASVSSKSGRESLRFWTPARMRQATNRSLDPVHEITQPTLSVDEPPPVEPASAVPRPYTSTLARIEGRLFARVNATTTFSCSGTVINSPGRDLIWTAAHCVQPGATTRQYTDMLFVPAYDSAPNNLEPYGAWPIRQAVVGSDWVREGSPEHSKGDYAVLVADTVNGRHIEDVVGTGAQVWFGAPAQTQVSAYGYPAEAPYNGGLLYVCQSPESTYRTIDPGPDLLWIGCTMTPGSSGGGWFALRDGAPYLVSNFSMYSPDQRHFGPQFAADAQHVYESVAGR